MSVFRGTSSGSLQSTSSDRRDSISLHHLLAIVLMVGIGNGACTRQQPSPSTSDEPSAAAKGTLVDPEPLLEIGASQNGGVALGTVTGATLLPDGLAIADNGAHGVLVFDLQGKLRTTLGREGSGPGEFRSVSTAIRCGGDSLFVLDNALKRTTVYDASLKRVREFRVPVSLHRAACSRGGVIAMLMQPDRFFGPKEMGRHPPSTAPLFLTSAEGDTIAPVGTVKFGDQRPLGSVTSLTMSDDRLYVAPGDSGYVDVYGLDGRPEERIPLGITPRIATLRDYEGEIDRLLWQPNRPDPDPVLRSLFLGIPMPKHIPAYRDVVATPGGTLWVTVSPAMDSVTEVSVFDRSGLELGRVTLPAGARLLEASENHLLATFQDGSGEPRVVLYRALLRR